MRPVNGPEVRRQQIARSVTMSKLMPDASRLQYVDSVRELITELRCLKAALAALGEWGHVECVEETIEMTRDLLKQAEERSFH